MATWTSQLRDWIEGQRIACIQRSRGTIAGRGDIWNSTSKGLYFRKNLPKKTHIWRKLGAIRKQTGAERIQNVMEGWNALSKIDFVEMQQKELGFFSALASKVNMDLINSGWNGMSLANEVWCLANVSSVSHSSEHTELRKSNTKPFYLQQCSTLTRWWKHIHHFWSLHYMLVSAALLFYQYHTIVKWYRSQKRQ